MASIKDQQKHKIEAFFFFKGVSAEHAKQEEYIRHLHKKFMAFYDLTSERAPLLVQLNLKNKTLPFKLMTLD